MPRLATLLSLGLCLALSACTVYRGQGEFFATSANIGITTSKIAEDDSQSSGLLSGGFQNDLLVESAVVPGSSLKVGSLEIHGPIDHSTPLDTAGHWTWRTLRSIVTGRVFSDLIGAGHSLAEPVAVAPVNP